MLIHTTYLFNVNKHTMYFLNVDTTSQPRYTQCIFPMSIHIMYRSTNLLRRIVSCRLVRINICRFGDCIDLRRTALFLIIISNCETITFSTTAVRRFDTALSDNLQVSYDSYFTSQEFTSFLPS